MGCLHVNSFVERLSRYHVRQRRANRESRLSTLVVGAFTPATEKGNGTMETGVKPLAC
jgi:hypothetical protein